MTKVMDLTVNLYGKDWKLDLFETSYPNGAPALVLHDSKYPYEPFATLTVNIPPHLPKPEEYFIKNWSENERIVNHLINERILIPTGERIPTGFVSAIVCKLEGGDRDAN